MTPSSLTKKQYSQIQKAVQTDCSFKIASPGRINLIGEHIDYNGGSVLPAAIEQSLIFSFRKNESQGTAHLLSQDYQEGFAVNLSEAQSATGWLTYLLGVLSEFKKICPQQIKGFDCVIESQLPIGAGVSSSAALLCGFAKGVNFLFDLQIDDLTLIQLCQRAEQRFSGANVGIMDQFAVVKGQQNCLLLLNCQSLEYEQIPADFAPYQLLLLNSNVKHSLGETAYNTRREECESALLALAKKYPQVHSLADASLEMIDDLSETLGTTQKRRAIFVVQEQQRVLKTVEALKQQDLQAVGRLLNQSHEGLQNLYEVSCLELDFLADFARKDSRVLGSRMMGGGFGGCTINLIHETQIESFVKDVAESYQRRYQIHLSPLVVKISDGVRQIKC